MSHLFLLCFFVPLLYQHVNAYSTGPPDSVCTTMQPSPRAHGSAQTSEAPYVIHVDKSYYANSGNGTVKVYVKACGERKIGGFLIQARENGKNVPLGNFTTIPQRAKYLDCTGNAIAETEVCKYYEICALSLPIVCMQV